MMDRMNREESNTREQERREREKAEQERREKLRQEQERKEKEDEERAKEQRMREEREREKQAAQKRADESPTGRKDKEKTKEKEKSSRTSKKRRREVINEEEEEEEQGSWFAQRKDDQSIAEEENSHFLHLVTDRATDLPQTQLNPTSAPRAAEKRRRGKKKKIDGEPTKALHAYSIFTREKSKSSAGSFATIGIPFASTFLFYVVHHLIFTYRTRMESAFRGREGSI